jgi:hypothetical protein
MTAVSDHLPSSSTGRYSPFKITGGNIGTIPSAEHAPTTAGADCLSVRV